MELKGVLEALNRHDNGQFRPPVFTHLTPLLTPRMTPPASAYHHCLFIKSYLKHELPRWLRGKESALSAGDVSSIPGPGRSSTEGNGNSLQYVHGEFHGQRSLVDYLKHNIWHNISDDCDIILFLLAWLMSLLWLVFMSSLFVHLVRFMEKQPGAVVQSVDFEDNSTIYQP